MEEKSKGVFAFAACLALGVALALFLFASDRSSGGDAASADRVPLGAGPSTGMQPLSSGKAVEPAERRPSNPERAPVTAGAVDAALETADSRSAVLQVEVVSATGGVVGVEVSADVDGRMLHRRTDASGVATFVADPGSLVLSVSVAATSTSCAENVRPAVVLRAAAPALLRVPVHRGVLLRGRVTDADGEAPGSSEALQVGAWLGKKEFPLPGERPDRVTTVGSDGEFVLSGVWGDFIVASVGGDWCTSRGLRGRIDGPGERSGLRVVVDRGHSYSLRLVDGAGRPVSGARVTRNGANYRSSLDSTHESGVFAVDGIAIDEISDKSGVVEFGRVPKSSTSIRIRHPHYPHQDHVVRSTRGQVSLQLESGIALSGQVTTPDGRAAAGATVRAFSEGGMVRSATTDEKGRYLIEGLPRGFVTHLGAHLTGYAPIIERGAGALEGPTAERHLRLREAFRIAGVVVDGSDRPLADLAIQAIGKNVVPWESFEVVPAPTWEQQFGLERTVTDARGRFEFTGLQSEWYELRVFAPGGQNHPISRRVRAPSADVVVVFDAAEAAGARLAGVVVDRLTQKPLVTARLFVTPTDGREGALVGTVRTLELDPRGEYELEGLRSGAHRLELRSRGYFPEVLRQVPLRDGDNQVDFALMPLGGAMIELRSSGESVPENLRYALRDEGGLSVSPHLGENLMVTQTIVDGRVELVGLPTQLLEFEVTDPEDGRSWSFWITPQREPTETTELWLD